MLIYLLKVGLSELPAGTVLQESFIPSTVLLVWGTNVRAQKKDSLVQLPPVEVGLLLQLRKVLRRELRLPLTHDLFCNEDCVTKTAGRGGAWKYECSGRLERSSALAFFDERTRMQIVLLSAGCQEKNQQKKKKKGKDEW